MKLGGSIARRRSGPARGPRMGSGGRRLFLYGFLALLLGSGGGYLYATQVVFPVPEEDGDEFRTVPDLRGLSLIAAEAELLSWDLVVVRVDSIRHPEQPLGVVLGQTPLPGQLALPGGEIRLTVSLGPERRPVPDVTRLRADRAITVLQTTGFTVHTDSIEADVPAGRIVATRPEAGTEVILPAEIHVVVSLGPPLVELPVLTGMQEELARELLDSLGLRVADPVETRFRFGFNQGQVLEQFPAPGELTPRGSEVRLVVGRRGFFEDEDRDE